MSDKITPNQTSGAGGEQQSWAPPQAVPQGTPQAAPSTVGEAKNWAPPQAVPQGTPPTAQPAAGDPQAWAAPQAPAAQVASAAPLPIPEQPPYQMPAQVAASAPQPPAVAAATAAGDATTPIMNAAGGIAPGKHHMHPAYVVMTAIRVVFAILVAGAVIFANSLQIAQELNSDNELLVMALIVGGLVLALAIALVSSFVYYKRFTWELTDSDIHIYSGILFKKQVHIPFARVQSIDFNAGVVERVLGIVRLKIDTAGGASNTGQVIPALKLSHAEALRTEVFARKKGSEQAQEAAMRQKMAAMRAAQAGQSGAEAGAYGAAAAGVGTSAAAATAATAASAAFGTSSTKADNFVREVGDDIGGLRGIFADQYSEEAPIEYEHGLSAKELFLSAISSDHNFVIFAVLLGALTQISQFLSLFNMEDALETAATYVVDNYVMPAIIVTIVIIAIVVFVLGIIGTAIQYGGFKCRRRGGRIEVEMGLISRQYKGVSVNRIQSVEIKQGFIRRLMGYAELKLLTVDSLDASQSNDGRQTPRTSGLLIHPFVKAKRIPEILAQLLPEYSDRPQEAEYKKLPTVALRRVIIRHVVIFTLFYAVFAGIATVSGWLLFNEFAGQWVMWGMVLIWGLLALLIVGKTIGAVLWYRHAAYAFNPRMLVLRSGFFGITTTLIPRRKIQWAQVKQTPFQRLAQVATVVAVTAAGIGGTSVSLRDLTLDDANNYLDWLRPKTALRNAESAE